MFMAKPKVEATSNERLFDVDQIFFSVTDKKGIIKYGNDVFVKISGHSSEKLLGSPHNIIRHPDMPKAVFKLFWDTLSENKPIAAFVKNMAANGDYYWVLATAFPVENGYLSIRIKPTSELQAVVEKVYKDLLREENSTSVGSAQGLLNKSLNELGFTSYYHFMIFALFKELKSLDHVLKLKKTNQNKLINTNRHKDIDHVIDQIDYTSENAAEIFKFLFQIIDNFESTCSVFQRELDQLSNEFNDLSLISLNLRVLASNFGDKGLAMGIISERFQSLATEIEAHLNSFSELSKSTIATIKSCTFNISAMKIQTDMVSFFVRESISKFQKEKISIMEAFKGLDENSNIFSKLCRQSAKSVDHSLTELKHRLNDFERSNREVKKFVNGLDVIEKMGKIEAGRSAEILAAIGGHLDSLAKFNVILRNSMTEIGSSQNTLMANTLIIEQRISTVSTALDTIFSLANKIRTFEMINQNEAAS